MKRLFLIVPPVLCFSTLIITGDSKALLPLLLWLPIIAVAYDG
jgi:hypothetical protein